MTEPMSKERLARLEASANADVYGLLPGEARELVAEVHRLREREKALHWALRRLAFDDLDDVCRLCLWSSAEAPPLNPERHAPGCLAAPMEDKP